MSELENFVKVEMVKGLTPQQFVNAMDRLEKEVEALKAVAIEAVDYLAVNLKKDSPKDYEPEKSPLIMGLREKIEGKA